MDRMAYRYPTWSDTDGQNDIVWCTLGGGSWTRAGLNFNYGHGHTHENASLDDGWHTHVYQGNSNDGVGAFFWYPRIYIKYNANGGSSTPSTQTKYIGSQISLANAISRTNYDFQGWSTSSTATTADYSAGLTIDYEAWNSISPPLAGNSGWTNMTPTHDGNSITLYAVWKGKTYEVAYNANGGSSTPTSQSVVYPNSCTLSDAISRSNGTSTSNGTITISYNVNGGNSTAPTASTGTYVNTTTTTYTFEKWHLNSTTGTAYAAKASYTPSADCTMYAGWTSSTSTARTTNPSITLTNTKPTKSSTTVSSYTVSYNANGGSSTPTAQTATKSKVYTFSKWNSKSDGTGTDYNANTAYTFSADATLYAKYTSSDSGGSVTLASAISRANGSTTGYSVTYNANGGSGAPSAQTSGNRAITYTFNKWAAGSASGTQYGAGTSFTPSANTTMYATWTSSTSSNSSWTCSSTQPTRTGYTFLGWSTSSTATTATYTAGTAYTITSALTLYAVWQINSYTLDVNATLDGVLQYNTSPMAKFDMYINGTLYSSQVSDYCDDYVYGTQYEIKNITVADEYIYTGVSENPLSGTLTKRTGIQLMFETKPNQAEIRYKDNGTWKKALISQKKNGSYVNVLTVYKKVNGTWVSAK